MASQVAVNYDAGDDLLNAHELGVLTWSEDSKAGFKPGVLDIKGKVGRDTDDPVDDQDWFKVEIEKAGQLIVSLEGSGDAGSNLAWELITANGEEIPLEVTVTPEGDRHFLSKAIEAGTFYIRLKNLDPDPALGTNPEVYTYNGRIALTRPDLGGASTDNNWLDIQNGSGKSISGAQLSTRSVDLGSLAQGDKFSIDNYVVDDGIIHPDYGNGNYWNCQWGVENTQPLGTDSWLITLEEASSLSLLIDRKPSTVENTWTWEAEEGDENDTDGDGFISSFSRNLQLSGWMLISMP